MATLARARAAKHKVAEMIADQPGVSGVGISRKGDQYSVKVNVSGEQQVDVPGKVGGVDVEVEVVGRISKQRKRS